MYKNNPYMVPEGFFEQARTDILASAGRIRRRRVAALTAVTGVAAIVIAVFLFSPYAGVRVTENEQYYAQIADEYSYDYFLQIQ